MRRTIHINLDLLILAVMRVAITVLTITATIWLAHGIR